ncbi:MAG: hypothetical protein ACQERZ_05440 [Fusobacteriota bacterium]
MRNLNPSEKDLIIKSLAYAFAIVVFLAILRIAAGLLIAVIPIAVIIYIILKIQSKTQY